MLVRLSTHLTGAALEGTFLRAELLRKRRFIPRIVLDGVNVIAGVLVAHSSRAALGRLLVLLALGLRALLLPGDRFELPLLVVGQP